MFAACRVDGSAVDGYLTIALSTSANTSTPKAAVCGQGTIAVGIGDGQFSTGFGLIVLQTGMTISACQRVVAVQLDVRIAAASHFHGGFVLIGVVAVFVLFINIDVHIFQGDIGRLVFVCVDGDRVLRACAGDGDFVVCVLIRSVEISTAVAVIFLLFPIHKPLDDEIAVFRSVDINGAVGDIIRTGKSRKGHAGHHGTGESESRDPLCGNAGRGSCLFLAEKHRNMPQDAHGESAIRDH